MPNLMRVLSLKDLLFFKNRVRVYAQFGDISIMDINTWNRILKVIDNFSTGTSRTTFLLVCRRIGFCNGWRWYWRVSLGRLLDLNKWANTIVVKSEGWSTVTSAFGQEIPNLIQEILKPWLELGTPPPSNHKIGVLTCGGYLFG